MILTRLIVWFGEEFCTFQAEFAGVAYRGQRQEIVITRRFDPFWGSWQFRQDTWIFNEMDELRDQDVISEMAHLELNNGWSPNWTKLSDRLSQRRLALAEDEWLDRPITFPRHVLSNELEAIAWGRVSPKVLEALATPLMDHDPNVSFNAAKTSVLLGKRDTEVIGSGSV